MVPAAGSCRNFEETRSIPATSRHFRYGLQRNQPEIYTEDGSSIPAGIYPYRNRRQSHRFQPPEQKGKPQYPPGSSRNHHRIPSEMAGNNNVSRWLRISTGFLIGFHSTFHSGFYSRFHSGFHSGFHS